LVGVTKKREKKEEKNIKDEKKEQKKWPFSLVVNRKTPI
jgi:hypothetical protein